MKLVLRLKSKYWSEINSVEEEIRTLAEKQGLKYVIHKLPSKRIGISQISERIYKALKLKIREIEIFNPEPRFGRKLVEIAKNHPKVKVEVYYH